ncbi:nucleoside hydrolase [Paenibacillus sp. P96]|uniref:Nucleoside hydrolase n=1 Tax=Paenibacillus zeirhizosphaerae TaxID=2987519 RepID=A0ABT9FN80_9BACL|nr:nucleoside hydrolase [Paenibacillus sp. P96]MDP4096198.1 nucleoside hydrolase [Paenibacillus sp. P96]
MKKVILDVDTGIDDALGIVLAVKSGRLNIQAITTVCGNVSLEQATLNTCKIMDLLEYPDIRVYKGADAPLVRKHYDEKRIHGEDGMGGALKNAEARTAPSAGFAPDIMINLAKQHPGELTLICTGPLTNLAHALLKCPELPRYVKEVIFMGGVIHGPGNVTPVAEYNMYADPEAARIVFHAGFGRLTQVGLDVTRKALLTAEDVAQMADPQLRAFVQESTADYTRRYEARYGVRACALHDPLAVGVAIEPSLVQTSSLYVDIETSSRLCDGQTVGDVQNRLGHPSNMAVCEAVNSRAFLDLFVREVGKTTLSPAGQGKHKPFLG